MDAKLKGSKGPKPKAIDAVISLRNLDGVDIEDGLYVLAPGKYATGKTRDGVPVSDLTPVTIPQALSCYRHLTQKIRPELDVVKDLDWDFLEDVEKWMEDQTRRDDKGSEAVSNKAATLSAQIGSLFHVLSHVSDIGVELHHIIALGELGEELSERQFQVLTKGGAE